MLLYVRFSLSLRDVEDLLHERGIEVNHETVRFWWQRFGPMFASGCCQGLQARSSDRDLSQADFIKASGHGYRTERPET